jgi:hypothetical protein
MQTAAIANRVMVPQTARIAGPLFTSGGFEPAEDISINDLENYGTKRNSIQQEL